MLPEHQRPLLGRAPAGTHLEVNRDDERTLARTEDDAPAPESPGGDPGSCEPPRGGFSVFAAAFSPEPANGDAAGAPVGPRLRRCRFRSRAVTPLSRAARDSRHPSCGGYRPRKRACSGFGGGASFIPQRRQSIRGQPGFAGTSTTTRSWPSSKHQKVADTTARVYARAARLASAGARCLSLSLTLKGDAAAADKRCIDSIPDLATLSDDDLRRLIVELTRQENEISYRRRLLQGRLDILRAEKIARLKRAYKAADD